ncbi:MAG: MYXO-CTERM sorting domain-containing protein [Phycisphaerales bacterium]
MGPLRAANPPRKTDFTAGDILVISDPDGPGPGGAAFFNTSVPYPVATYFNFRIEHVGSAQFSYFLNNTLIAGPLFGFHNAAGIGSPGWEEVVFLDDQFQIAGERGDFDNFSSIPAPGAAALLGLGGLLLSRRRR